jgi:hypothetical protein
MLIKKVRIEGIVRPDRYRLPKLTHCNVGCRRPQASRAQPQGQGLQVPPNSHRVAYPPSCPLLQVRRRPASYLEVRVRYRQHHCRIKRETIPLGWLEGWQRGDLSPPELGETIHGKLAFRATPMPVLWSGRTAHLCSMMLNSKAFHCYIPCTMLSAVIAVICPARKILRHYPKRL